MQHLHGKTNLKTSKGIESNALVNSSLRKVTTPIT